MVEISLLRIINGCYAMEETVASIYNRFKHLFPEEKVFWEDLIRDEMQHQAWLSDPTFIESVDLLPSQDLLPAMDLIESSIKNARNMASRISSNPVTL